MENSQTVQESDKGKAPTPQVENGTLEPITIRYVLMYLLGNYPWLFVVALLVIFLGVGALSLYSLSSVGVVEQTKPDEQEALSTEVVEPTNPQPEQTNPIPLWVVVAIALSCASGCLIILRLLNQPTSYAKAQKQINRHSVQNSQYPKKLKSLPPKSISTSLATQSQPPVTIASTKTKPRVTVLPQEPKRHKPQESLANMLDIRQENPLSTIVPKK